MTAAGAFAPGPADRAVLDAWWHTFVATGRLPDQLSLVQGRLVRTVHRGELPSGPVYVKTMTFPRGKDRLRYLLRALPGAHEAAMLRHLAAASVPCPEVVDVRTARRFGLPWRSLLVLRALPVVEETASPAARLTDEAKLAARLLALGVEHHDLHSGNFVRTADGRLAVLDLQSARRSASAGEPKARLRAAARLVRDTTASESVLLDALREGGLVRDAAEARWVVLQRHAERLRHLRSRAHRCLTESTGYTWRFCWNGREFRRRGELGPGRWVRGGRRLRRAWIGCCALQQAGRPSPDFRALFQNWWWLGGRCALYVPIPLDADRLEAAVQEALDGWHEAAARPPVATTSCGAAENP